MLRKILLASIGILVMASCATKKPKSDADGAAAGGADNGAPVIADKEMNFNPQGSDSGAIPGLGTVFFELDQSRLTNDARQQLATNAEWIKGNPAVTIQIEGHTDERGSVEYNLSLGERRAKSVKAYLTSLGIDAKRLTIISYGEEKPLESGSSESAWAKNRRANFVPLAQ
ncbi:MAG: peptidoglycan-associated lipoprotein Pal [Bdellovibrionaceae bacterium]|nr:peptidoglycan-associated lipoprotein Pal [Pseudobdellovibrionaceae bacterium]